MTEQTSVIKKTQHYCSNSKFQVILELELDIFSLKTISASLHLHDSDVIFYMVAIYLLERLALKKKTGHMSIIHLHEIGFEKLNCINAKIINK